MAQVGNKINSCLNGEWAKHVHGKWKRTTSHLRRSKEKELIIRELKELT